MTGRRIVGCLHREPYYGPGGCCTFDRGTAGDVEASPDADCCLPIREDSFGRYVGLRCPDWGGDRIAWAEAGRVPGSRECQDCGSRLTDSRYGCLLSGAECVRRRAAVVLIEDPAARDPISGDGGRTIAAARLPTLTGWTAADREAAVIEARENLQRNPALRRSLRAAIG